MNGRPNPARPVALTDMAILCVSLAVFWYYLPLLFTLSRRGSRLIQWAGMASMLSAFFIFTDLHDLVINIAGFFGLIALADTFIGLYKSWLLWLFWLGICCLLLMLVNNFIYYTGEFFYFLPVVQKITFAFVLFWISLLMIKVYAQQSLPD